MKRKKEPKNYYHISSVSKMFNIHPQTLRLYEREGLLRPSRSEGNTRCYTDEDLRRLELILNLTRELGVNLAGVEVVINMRRKIEQIEEEVNMFLDYIRKEFFEGKEEEFELRTKSLVRVSPAKIIRIEKEKEKNDD
jgi:MerR family transcriptional regulator/heat shock protein HspR